MVSGSHTHLLGLLCRGVRRRLLGLAHGLGQRLLVGGQDGIVKLHPAKQYLRDYYQIPASATAYQSNDIMTAITDLRFLSYRHQMPLVICLSLGTNQGSHDGTSPLSQTLNHLNTLRGVCSVCSAGN